MPLDRARLIAADRFRFSAAPGRVLITGRNPLLVATVEVSVEVLDIRVLAVDLDVDVTVGASLVLVDVDREVVVIVLVVIWPSQCL